MKASVNYVIGSSARIPTKGLAIGDSIVANYEGMESITHYLYTSGDYSAGYDVLNQAVGGDTIEQQQAIFEADPNKDTYDWVIIQIGVNNLSNSNAIADIRSAYQTLVDYVRANGKDGVKIILSTMTPCKERLDAIGYSYANWLLLNESIRGEGANPITGADGICSTHTGLLNDGSDNLNAIYESPANDHIHPNNAGREIIAVNSWKPKLTEMGLFTP